MKPAGRCRTRELAAAMSAIVNTVRVTSFVAVVAACHSSTEPGPGSKVDSLVALPRAVTAVEQKGIGASNGFALTMLREATNGSTGNVLLSPLSVWTALGLTMNGAAGNTESAMRATLGWTGNTRDEINAAYRDLAALLPTLDAQVTFKSANGIWVRDPLVANAGFVSDATQFFGATVANAASPEAMFSAVNAWANLKTEGLVPQALSEPPPQDLLMLLANALLFKGTWRDRFDPQKTVTGPFRLESGASVNVPLMTRRGSFRGGGDSEASVMELTFGNSAYAMLLLVPRTVTVGDYVALLDSARLARAIASLVPETNADIALPRFRVTGSMNLRSALQRMGMGVAFSDVAEFPRLFSTTLGVKLSFVQHTVTVDVDEAGARAAAVTVVGVVPTSLPPSFRADRPFVFFIRERFTGTLLFAGVVRDPR